MVAAASFMTATIVGCRAQDTGPSQAQVLPAPVYPAQPAVATRDGDAVPPDNAPTPEQADRGLTTLPTTWPATRDTYRDDRNPAASTTSPPIESYGSVAAGVGNYDYGTPWYDPYPADYYVDRNYWAASPYYYNNFYRFGAGYGYPYSQIDGRLYGYRQYSRDDRRNPRHFERDWNERAKYRDRWDREDRRPRTPYAVTDNDRDGNGIDDRRDDGRGRPARDAGAAYRERQQRETNEAARRDPLEFRRREEQTRQDAFAEQQRADVEGRRAAHSNDADARRDANRAEAEARREANRAASESRRDARRDDSPRRAAEARPDSADRSRQADTPRRSDPPRSSDAPRRESAPDRPSAPRRSDAPARDDTPRRTADPAPARESSPARDRSSADRPTRDAGAARESRRGGDR